jgi:hypothetical protein
MKKLLIYLILGLTACALSALLLHTISAVAVGGCQCECGNIVDAYESALLTGVTISCGCQNQSRPKRAKVACAA